MTDHHLTKQPVKFGEMTPRQKFVFVIKVTLSVISFGFIYPNIMSD